MIVRPATPADHPTWAAMLARLHAPETSVAQFLDEIRVWQGWDEPMFCWLAEDADGRVLGMVDARLRNYAEGAPDGSAPYIEDLWVEEHARRRGVGRALVAAVRGWAKADGHAWLGSDALLDNPGSHAFHLALGFAEIERLVVFGRVP